MDAFSQAWARINMHSHPDCSWLRRHLGVAMSEPRSLIDCRQPSQDVPMLPMWTVVRFRGPTPMGWGYGRGYVLTLLSTSSFNLGSVSRCSNPPIPPSAFREPSKSTVNDKPANLRAFSRASALKPSAKSGLRSAPAGGWFGFGESSVTLSVTLFTVTEDGRAAK